ISPDPVAVAWQNGAAENARHPGDAPVQGHHGNGCEADQGASGNGFDGCESGQHLVPVIGKLRPCANAAEALRYIFEYSNMSSMTDIDAAARRMTELETRAEDAVALLAAMANPKRLLILCHLLQQERSVGELS